MVKFVSWRMMLAKKSGREHRFRCVYLVDLLEIGFSLTVMELFISALLHYLLYEDPHRQSIYRI